MNIYTKPIITIGIELEGQLHIVPFFYVTILDKHNLKKTILVNWTHGQATPDRKITFATELGDFKQLQLQSIQPSKGLIVRVFQEGDIKSKILEQLADSKQGDIILFVWPKSISTEDPFYEALNLMVNRTIIKSAANPITLSSIGFRISHPFIEVEH